MWHGGRACELVATGAGAAAAYWEVYVDDFYGLRKMSQPSAPATIVDIGANVGFFSCFARIKFPSARIIAYEPNPEAFRWLEHNTRKCAIELHPAAIGREDGRSSFDIATNNTLGRLAAVGAFDVTVIGTRNLAEGASIDLLKMDCEGGEWDILEDRSLLARTRRIVMEYHLTGNRTWNELTGLLAAGGHRVERFRSNESAYGFLASVHHDLSGSHCVEK